MPRKIRQLKADLQRVGCVMRPGKGSHTVWEHPLLTDKIVLSGQDGDDAKPYQEKDVRAFLIALFRAQERSR
ncbi:MAG: type II toxin-antitoxin system HicA family toxin [Thermomicrobiales bacterium]